MNKILHNKFIYRSNLKYSKILKILDGNGICSLNGYHISVKKNDLIFARKNIDISFTKEIKFTIVYISDEIINKTWEYLAQLDSAKTQFLENLINRFSFIKYSLSNEQIQHFNGLLDSINYSEDLGILMYFSNFVKYIYLNNSSNLRFKDINVDFYSRNTNKLNSLTLIKSMMQLESSAKEPITIAKENDFKSYNTFFKFIKNSTNYTPNQYRKTYREYKNPKIK